MSRAGRTPLYTPEMLAAAVRLAEHPLHGGLPLRGEARSRSCGSVVAVGLEMDPGGRILEAGCRVQACAVGQAAAAAFLAGAVGRTRSELSAARTALADWLGGTVDLPDWPDLGLIAAARDYPARHGAVVLAWEAALAALASPAPVR